MKSLPTVEALGSTNVTCTDHILNAATGIEVGFFGSIIGVLSGANFFLYMHRHDLTLGQDAIGTIEYARARVMTWLIMAFYQFVNILSRRYQNVSL